MVAQIGKAKKDERDQKAASSQLATGGVATTGRGQSGVASLHRGGSAAPAQSSSSGDRRAHGGGVAGQRLSDFGPAGLKH